MLELTGGSSGGQNYADGWWEGAYALHRIGGHNSLFYQVSTLLDERAFSQAIMYVQTAPTHRVGRTD